MVSVRHFVWFTLLRRCREIDMVVASLCGDPLDFLGWRQHWHFKDDPRSCSPDGASGVLCTVLCPHNSHFCPVDTV